MPSPLFDPVLADAILAIGDDEAVVVDQATRDEINSPTLPERLRFADSDRGRAAATKYLGAHRAVIRERRIAENSRPRLLAVDDARSRMSPDIRRIIVAMSHNEAITTCWLAAALPLHEVLSLKNHIHPALTVGGDLELRLHRLERPASPSCALYILAVMRTGSYLLAELATHLRLGEPAEHLRDPIVEAVRDCSRRDLSIQTWWNSLERVHASPSGWFGTKLITHYVQRLKAVLLPSEEEWFDSRISSGHLVTVIRDDRVSQAVSAYRAQQTGVYRATNDKQLERAQRNDVPYDFEALLERYSFLGQETEFLFSYADKLKPHDSRFDLTYEQLAADPLNTAERLAALASLKDVELPQQLRNRKLSSKTKSAMVEAFRADLSTHETTST